MIPAILDDVHFGEVDKPLPDWRADVPDDEDESDDVDDELLSETPEDVIEMLGFDPLELEEDAADLSPASSTKQAAVTTALESVDTTESFDPTKHPRDPGGDDGGQFVDAGAASELASSLEKSRSDFDSAPSQQTYDAFREKAIKGVQAELKQRGWYPITDRAASSDYVRAVAYDADENEVDSFTVRISNHRATHGGFDYELRIDKGGFDKDLTRILAHADRFPEDADRSYIRKAIKESTRRAAVSAALESVHTTDEARAVLQSLEAYP